MWVQLLSPNLEEDNTVVAEMTGAERCRCDHILSVVPTVAKTARPQKLHHLAADDDKTKSDGGGSGGGSAAAAEAEARWRQRR